MFLIVCICLSTCNLYVVYTGNEELWIFFFEIVLIWHICHLFLLLWEWDYETMDFFLLLF